MTENITPNPGSDAALDKGCTCPIFDNAHGRGYLGEGKKFGWVINCGCPLHGDSEVREGTS